ncbi:Vegetative incompatibility protein HET-E-1 [Beauveria bassiana]|nr:Vegetative incompatibility protein HET-E-1 [Beauveria bassiana]
MDRFSKRGDDLISDRDALWGVLEDVLGDAKSGQLYFILDGLDECDAESQHFLLVKLTSLFLSTSVAAQDISIKLIMTSRPSTDMDILFADTSPAILDISIHSGMVNADLTAYIDQKVDVIAREKSYPEDLAKETKAALRRGAEGTFLWASLVLQDLRRAALFEVEGILGNLPKGLYGVYDQILSRMDKHAAEHSRQILCLVMAAKRPLSRQELAAVIISATERRHDEDRAKMTPLNRYLDAFKVCQPLLHHDNDHNTVRVFHQSANDYFMSDHLKTSLELSHFYFKKNEADFLIFQACWEHYLATFFGEQSGHLSNAPLRLYAPEHLLSHATQSPEELFDHIQWPKTVNGTSILDEWLFAEVKAGRLKVVRLLLEHGVESSAFDLSGSAAIHYAAAYGYIEIARELLDRGADVNQATSVEKEPRVFVPPWTFMSIYFDLQDFVFDIKWETDDNHSCGRVALHCAAAAGKADMVRFLLSRGANILATSDDHCSVVEHAQGLSISRAK